MSAAFLGDFVEKDIHKASLIAAICFAVGVAGTGLAIKLHSQLLVILFYGVIMGIGLGLGYLSPVKTLMLWFKDNKGLATGLAVAGFGAAKMVFSPIITFLEGKLAIEYVFFILAGVWFVMMFIGHLLLKKPDGWVERHDKFEFKKLRFNGFIVKQVLSIGIMSGIQSAMFNITNIIAQAYLVKIGPDVPASNAAQSNISGYISTISGAFYQAALAFTAQNVGAKNFPYIKKIQRYSLLVSVSSTIVFSAIVFALRSPLLRIFTDDEEVLGYALKGLMIIVPGYFLWDIGEVSTGISKGLGSNAVPMILTAIFSCLFRILYFVFIFPYYGSYEIVIAVYPISWAFLAVFQYGWSKIVYKKAYKKYMLESNLT